MAFEEYNKIIGRISLENDFDFDDIVDYAARQYWAMVGFLTNEDDVNIIKEGFFKPANHTIIINFIEDAVSNGALILIRIPNDYDKELDIHANSIYQEMLLKLPAYSLDDILQKFNSLSSLSENEIHALGKGYDPQLQTEIVQLLNQVSQSNDSTVKQKKATIIAIGYISDPLHFNPILELLTQDLDSEVAKLAQSMLEAGQAVIKQE